jgi:integrase
MALSDAKVRNARPLAKSYKITDGQGLFLQVNPTGSKYWRLKYHFAGKEKLLALGVYPDVSLEDAREKRGNARKILAAGGDPSKTKQEAKRKLLAAVENSFELVAREWFLKQKKEWKPNTAKTVLNRLENDILPKLGTRPVGEINAPEVLHMLRAIEKRGALDMAKRAMQTTGQVFMYAIATGRAERNPVPDLKGSLEKAPSKHRAYLKEAELPEFLRMLETYDGHPETKLAIRFLMLTFVRTIEMRAAEWQEINFEKAEWRIPPSRMKMKEEHIVPLSRQAIALLKALNGHSGNRQYLFPKQSKYTGFMSENTVLYALYRLGYHSRATGHGFRSTASTILNENGFSPDVIERQLAHGERNKVRAAYNHAQYLPERRKMMQWWADYLDKISVKN